MLLPHQSDPVPRRNLQNLHAAGPGRKGPSLRSSMGGTGVIMVELPNDRLVVATKMEPSVADIVRS
jgi:hypothetical protein